MSSILKIDKFKAIFNAINSPKRKLSALILFLFLFTKIGTPNILYILQYIGCIIKLIIFKKRIKYASSTAIYHSRVHLYDIDFWFHMNNAAYLRHAELARVDYFIRSKLWNQLKQKEYGIAFVALNIRYRRELTLFKPFEIQTRPLFWDELQLIMEQRFVDPNTKFLHTIIYGKYVLIKNGKKVKRSINNNLSGDGLHIINFYEKPSINTTISESNNNENISQRNNGNFQINRPLIHVSSTESINSSQNGYVEYKNGGVEPEMVAEYDENKEDNDDIEDIISYVNNRDNKNLTRNFYNIYECRNKIPRSLRIWMQCLEQSSYESRRNLL